MTAEEIEAILKPLLQPERNPSNPPSPQDWERLRNKFQCDFHPDFITFYEVVGKYEFLGELLSAAKLPNEDTIEVAYDSEFVSVGRWPAELIPFYAIGNGDYYCLNASMGASSPVFYIYHDDSSVEETHPSFTAWIQDLPDFLKNLLP